MLDKLVAFLPSGIGAVLRPRPAPPAGRGQAGLDRAPDHAPGFDARPAPMPPLAPPAATNDNPLRAVHEAVERDLRAGGHLQADG